MPSSARRYKLPRPPGERVAKRNARKEKLVKCVLAPRRPPHHPPRDGSIDLAEEHSVPEGQPKSEQAPIRRPPSRAEGHCTGARLAPFSFGPCTARFLFGQDRKENGGCIPLDKPPAGAETRWPPDGGPYRSQQRPDLIRSPHVSHGTLFPPEAFPADHPHSR